MYTVFLNNLIFLLGENKQKELHVPVIYQFSCKNKGTFYYLICMKTAKRLERIVPVHVHTQVHSTKNQDVSKPFLLV